MTDPAVLTTIAGPLAAACCGTVLGHLYFIAVRRTAQLFGTAGWRLPLVLTVGRLLAVAAAFSAVAQFGAVPLLAAFLGFLTARHLSLRRCREMRA